MTIPQKVLIPAEYLRRQLKDEYFGVVPVGARVYIYTIEDLVMLGDAWTVRFKIHSFTRVYGTSVLTRKETRDRRARGDCMKSTKWKKRWKSDGVAKANQDRKRRPQKAPDFEDS